MWHIAAVYKFADLPQFKDLRERIYGEARKRRIKGTLLLADEGINATLACPDSPAPLQEFFAKILSAIPGLEILTPKWSQAMDDPFRKLKIRLKKEIVTLGVPDIKPHISGGEHVDPRRWDRIISDPRTVVIDTRNDYEFALGTFKGALNPKTASFRDFPAYVSQELSNDKDRPIAMFCTGGIRCEKASAYMRNQGFREVYQLGGGILNYIEKTEATTSNWQGDCFVFDDRVAVTHALEPSGHSLCPACRQPLTEKDKRHVRYIAGESCPACYDTKSQAAKASSRERYKQMMLAAKRGVQHLKRE